MACCECPRCGWIGNSSRCVVCGNYTLWDELEIYDEYLNDDESSEEDYSADEDRTE